MTFDARGTCGTCGARCVGLVTHTGRHETNAVTGAFRWVQWSSCEVCNGKDETRWDEQRRDEERERQERHVRIAAATERDRVRAERQRARGAQT